MKIKKLVTLFFISLMFLCSCTNANNSPSESNDSSTIAPSSDSTNTSSFEVLSLTLDSGQKFNYYLNCLI